ncbi:MAG: hypothetical protein EBT93_06395 [Alphaproteobacteria bacterium]|nr:hypothetical protein [Alphaproteobacteria bacterium]
MAKGGETQEMPILPSWQEKGYQQGLNLAKDVSQVGYVPYYGPDVAAFSPLQQASFQGTDVMANAFGMPTTGGQQYMPQAETYAGGVQGYSSAPIYTQAKEALAANAPAQSQYLASFGIDPVTGAVGSRAVTNQPYALEMGKSSGGGK